ncbi:hypothetical protein F2Q70_00011029 [Brassica cretica]|uniref:Folate receptor-like domain-containing protein n=1 Tax=Brassica cretica TaxID=69181 RepID=A0A8S9M508_BRACR|nr:hypothetical protein F2Q70_00011029 [Brassica cretica]
MAKINQAITIFFLLLLSSTTSHPLCSDSKTQVSTNQTLEFCDSYSGKTCCNSKDDLELQNRFNSMNISDSNCSSLLKSILCAKCDQFSGQLFGNETSPIPILCNSTSQDLCSKLWDTCQNISIVSSPFSPTLLGGATSPSTPSTLTDLWKSQTEFCTAFGGPEKTNNNNTTKCFNGEPVNQETDIKPPQGICVEKIGTGSYLNMVAHPDGSNRAFFSNQPGKIWLGTIPDQDSGEAMELDESTPFVDITDQVSFDTQFEHCTSFSLHHRLILPPPSLTLVSPPLHLIEISATSHLLPSLPTIRSHSARPLTFPLLKPIPRFSTTRIATAPRDAPPPSQSPSSQPPQGAKLLPLIIQYEI